jgi:S1-C subfamily serine protease
MKNKTKKYFPLFTVVLVLLALLGICGAIYTKPNIEVAKSYNVLIEGMVERNGELLSYWMGSGVIISKDGNIVTAKHCVNEATKLKVTLQDGTYYYVTDFFKDKDADVAIIDIPGNNYKYAEIGDSDTISKGDKLFNIGNASGIWENSVFYGVVYKNHFTRYIFPNTELILLRMKVFGGCSGGGLYKGDTLYGIVVMGDDVKMTLAVPSNIVSNLYKRYLTAMDFEIIAEYFLSE